MNLAEKPGSQKESAIDAARVSLSLSHPCAIPDHELTAPIASGAYGEVWLARSAVGTLRAVKIVLREQHTSAESFEREFKGLQKFEPVSRSHEGLVDILTLGLLPDSAGFYYVMELADPADGADKVYSPRTLRADFKSRGALPADEVIALGLKLTAALAHLHARGLVHRDVKPSNILFIGGEPKLADAGLVAAVDDARSLVGTTGYIAPEGPGTPQADLYALGKVLYEGAFGKDRHQFPALPADVASRPDHSRLLELNEVIATACAHDPEQRYASAAAMLAELATLNAGNSVKRIRAIRRCLALGAKVGISAILVGAMLFVATRFVGPRQDRYAESDVPEVNSLVEQGELALREETPEALDRADKFFQRAVELDPKFVPAHYGLTSVDIHIQDAQHMRRLRATAVTMMDLAPDSAEAWQVKAFLEMCDGHFIDAVADAQQATKLRAYCREGAAWAHGACGLFLEYTGDADGAMREYQIGAKLYPAEPTLQDHLGHPYFMRGEFKEALKHYQASLDLQPKHPNGLYWKARALEEMGDFESAINTWVELDQVYHRFDDKRTRYYEDLRLAARQGGREAYWRRKLDELSKESPQDYYRIAALHAHLGEADAAFTFLNKAFSQHEHNNSFVDLFNDPSWNRNDERFKAFARKVGLMR